MYFVSATDPTRSLRTNNHTLPSHLRLCSLFVASYDSQGHGGGILTRFHTGSLLVFKVKSKSKSCYDWWSVGQSVSQSVCLGVESTLELVTRYYFLSESWCIVSVGRPLWWEVGSVFCQSMSAYLVRCPKFNIIYILHVTHLLYIYIYIYTQ
jgi:hypothetical protein